MEMKHKMIKQVYINYLIVFIVCFIPRMVISFQMLITSYNTDEISTMSTAAIVAGYDWSNVVSRLNYYGGGMTFLFAPFFKIMHNPLQIYHAMLVMVCLFQALAGIIAYKILSNYLIIDNVKVRMLLAITSSYVVVRRSNNITNEHMLILITWFMVYLLLKLLHCRQRKEKVKYTIILGIVLGYALAVHERGLLFFLALLCVLIVFFYVYRDSLVSVVSLFSTYFVAYVASRIFKNLILSFSWGSETSVANTEVQVGSWKLLLSPYYWRSWLSIVFGQITTINMVTGGIFLLVTILACIVLYRMIFLRKKFVNQSNDLLRDFIVLFTFLFAGVFGTILAQSFSWLEGVNTAYLEGYASGGYGLKALTYIRYFGNYIGPIFMLGMYVIYSKKEKILLKIAGINVGITTFLSFFWMTYIWPYIQENRDAVEAFLPFTFEKKPNMLINESFYTIGIVIMIIGTLLIWILLKYKKRLLIIVLLSFLVFYQYVYNSFAFDRPMGYYYADIVNTYKIVNKIDKTALPQKIYILNEDESFTTYQLLFFDKQIELELPDSGLDSGLIISNSEDASRDLISEGWNVLENDEIVADTVLVKGEKIEKAAEKADIQLLNFTRYHGNVNSEQIASNANNLLYAGTYNVELSFTGSESLSAKKDDYSLGVFIAYNADGSEAGRYPITKKMITEGISNIRFSTQKDVSAHFCFYQSEENGIELSNVTWIRTAAEAVVGLDFSDEIKQHCEMITGEQCVVSVMNNDRNLDLSILKELIGQDAIVQENTTKEIQNSSGVQYVLARRSDADWLTLTNRIVVGNSEHYILLETTDQPPGIFDISEMKSQTNSDENIFWGLDMGEYYFEVECDNLDENNSYIAQFQSPEMTMDIPLSLADGRLYGSTTLYSQTSNWSIEVKCGDVVITSNAIRIKKISTMQSTYAETKLNTILAACNTLKVEELDVYRKIDSISDKSMSESIASVCGIKKENLFVDICKYNGEIKKEKEYIILPYDDIEDVYSLIASYNIVCHTAEYTLLKKVSENTVETSEKAGILFESYDKIIQSDYYYNKDIYGNEYSTINLPTGQYKVTVELTVPVYLPDSFVAAVSIPSENTVLENYMLDVNTEAHSQQIITKEIVMSNLNCINGLLFNINYNEENIPFVVKTIEVLNNDFVYPIEQMTESKSGIYTTNSFSMNKGETYTCIYTYKCKKPKIEVSSYSTDTEKVNKKATNSKKVEEDVYQTVLVVKPSDSRPSDVFTIDVSDSKEFELIDFVIQH